MDITYDDAVKKLKADEIFPIYVFYGEENFLKRRMLDDLLKKAVGDDLKYNFSMFDSDKAFDALCDAAESAPFFAIRRIVMAKDMDFSKLTAENLRRFEEILEICDEALTFVFYYTGETYKLDKKIAKMVEEKGAAINFETQSDKKLESWLKRQAASVSKQLDENAARYIIEASGKSMEHMYNEMAKILNFSSKQNISLEDVKKTAVPTVEIAVYALTDALTTGQYSLALERLNSLLKQGEETTVILGALASNIIKLYRIKTAESAGVSRQQVMADLKMKDYPYSKLKSASDNLDIKNIRRWLRCCAEADAKLKGYSGLSKQMILEKLICEMKTV